jgi:thioredoxin 1
MSDAHFPHFSRKENRPRALPLNPKSFLRNVLAKHGPVAAPREGPLDIQRVTGVIMLELHEANFDQTIARGAFVVDFSAEWCPPCRALEPIFARAAQLLVREATFATVDAEASPKLLRRFNIMALPTVIVCIDGQPLLQIRGLHAEASLLAQVRRALTENTAARHA